MNISETKRSHKRPKYSIKPKNSVLPNMQAAGAGDHKDKKKDDKNGVGKHKKRDYAEHLESALNTALTERQDQMAGVGMGEYGANEEYDGGPEYNDEVGMVKNNLSTMVHAIKELLEIMKDDENLPEWVQEKIAQSKGMLVAAKDYMMSQHAQGEIYHTNGSHRESDDPVYEWTHDSLAYVLFEQEITYEDRLNNALRRKLKK